MISGFSHIYLPVRDVDESIAFYTEHLGFRLLRKWSANGRASAYLTAPDGVLLELTLANRPSPGGEGRVESRIGLTVTDMDALIADLRAKGVKVAREPYEARTFWGRQAGIVDPSGNGVSLREWREPDGPNFDGWQPNAEGFTRLA
jgi:catechol 2,3-dioxygenase-like lactoylglutathione lyase family enzyme